MKNKLMVGTFLIGMLFATSVEAQGKARVEFSSNDTVQVGETFTVKMSVKDIENTYDGIVSMGGDLSFDSTKLEYISSKGIETPYVFQMNEENYRIAGLDFTLDNGIREEMLVYEFTFKAKDEGTAQVTLENAKLTDSQDYIDTVILGTEITIEEKEEVIISELVETKNNFVEEIEEESYDEEIIEENILDVQDNDVLEEQEETIVVEEKESIVTEEEIEQETFAEKLQKVFNNLFSKIKKLFK